MRFAYLRDPLFLVCFTLYWVNRFVIKPFSDISFFHDHFNDLICIPFLLPIVLWAARRFRLRGHDLPPLVHEVMIALVVWSVLFEIWFPQLPFWNRWVTGDPMDVFFYAIGACGAMCFWQVWYSPRMAYE